MTFPKNPKNGGSPPKDKKKYVKIRFSSIDILEIWHTLLIMWPSRDVLSTPSNINLYKIKNNNIISTFNRALIINQSKFLIDERPKILLSRIKLRPLVQTTHTVNIIMDAKIL